MNLEEAKANIGAEVELDETTKPYTWCNMNTGEIEEHDETSNTDKLHGTLRILEEIDGNISIIADNRFSECYSPKHLKLKPQNYKIHVPTEEESREAQELFFELGYEWMNSEKYIQHTDIPYLYSYSDEMKIAMGWSDELFDSHKNKQINLQELRDMVAKKKPQKEMIWQDALRAVADGKRVEYSYEGEWFKVDDSLDLWFIKSREGFRLAPQRIYLNGNFTKEELLQKAGEME